MFKSLLVSLILLRVGCFCHAEDIKPASPLFLNALPQSGTFYISETLCDFYQVQTYRVTKRTFPRDRIFENAFSRFIDQSLTRMVVAHADPSAQNIDLLHHELDRFILHVRDPRDSLISWVDFVDRHEEHKYTLGRVPPLPPADYFNWNREKKIDWQIEHFYKYSLQWLQEWVVVLEQHPELEVKLTTFEQMVKDPLHFFQDLVAYYEGNPLNFSEENVLQVWKSVFYFDQDDVGIWKEQLTPKQQIQVNSMIPDVLFFMFDWKEN